MKLKKAIALFSLIAVAVPSQGGRITSYPAPDADTSGVVQTLLDLLTLHDDLPRLTPEEKGTAVLEEINSLITPAGKRIQLRYNNFGVSLVEALRTVKDPDVRKRLVEVVQWSRTPEVRADALVTLASFSDPEHKKYFKQAVLDSKIVIRFAALEALQQWNQPAAVDLLKLARDRDWSPFNRIFASQALLAMGDEQSIDVLWWGLDHKSWVIRAMAAHYLGDFAKPTDYKRLLPYISKESKNDFVLTELSIAALKLISRTGEKIAYSPASPGWRSNEEVRYHVGEGGVIEVEPLVIVPPRLRIPHSLQVASQINTELLRLLRERLDDEMGAGQRIAVRDPIEQQDPILTEELSSLTSPTGFALRIRYAGLSYLLIEALAGSQDPQIRSELERLARSSARASVRAIAGLALSYNRQSADIALIQEALRDRNVRVRFAALEAIEAGRFKEALPYVHDAARTDASPVVQVYAMQMLSKFGDISGRHLMLGQLDNPEWPVRSLAIWYLGRYGEESDYSMLQARLPFEQNRFAKSELVLGYLRLSPF